MAVLVVASLGVAGTACSSGPEPSREALCEQLLLTEGLDEALATGDATALEAQAEALQGAVDVAPPDVRPAVIVLSDTVTVLVTTIDTAGGDRSEALREVLGAREAEADAVAVAGNAVTAWTGANCGVDLESGDPVPTTPPPSPPSPPS